MLNSTKVNDTSFDKLKRRLVKILRFGKADIQERNESMPYGLDSNPIKNMVAIYGKLGTDGKAVIIGYLNPNQLAGVGEFRVYSTDVNGTLQTYIWLHNTGHNMEIGGKNDNLVRYAQLDLSLQKFKALIQVELGKIQTGIVAAGGTYTAGALTIDTSKAKIDRIKTLDINNT